MKNKSRVLHLEKAVNKIISEEGPLKEFIDSLKKDYPAKPGDKRSPLARLFDDVCNSSRLRPTGLD